MILPIPLLLFPATQLIHTLAFLNLLVLLLCLALLLDPRLTLSLSLLALFQLALLLTTLAVPCLPVLVLSLALLFYALWLLNLTLLCFGLAWLLLLVRPRLLLSLVTSLATIFTVLLRLLITITISPATLGVSRDAAAKPGYCANDEQDCELLNGIDLHESSSRYPRLIKADSSTQQARANAIPRAAKPKRLYVLLPCGGQVTRFPTVVDLIGHRIAVDQVAVPFVPGLVLQCVKCQIRWLLHKASAKVPRNPPLN